MANKTEMNFERIYSYASNSCENCTNLNQEKRCNEYPAMRNQIRCMNYTLKINYYEDK